VCGHHVYTNVYKWDPDVTVVPDVVRMSPHHPLKKYHKYQHLFTGFLYALLAHKRIVSDDFHILKSGMVGNTKVSPMKTSDVIVFYSGKLFYFTWAIMLPLLRGNYSTMGIMGLLFFSEMFHGMVLAFMFALAHVGEKADHLELVDNKVDMGWA